MPSPTVDPRSHHKHRRQHPATEDPAALCARIRQRAVKRSLPRRDAYCPAQVAHSCSLLLTPNLESGRAGDSRVPRLLLRAAGQQKQQRRWCRCRGDLGTLTFAHWRKPILVSASACKPAQIRRFRWQLAAHAGPDTTDLGPPWTRTISPICGSGGRTAGAFRDASRWATGRHRVAERVSSPTD